MSSDLRSFLDNVRAARGRDLIEIEREVSPRFETTAILAKFEERHRTPILLFKNVTGSNWPVVTNVCGSLGRMAFALDCPLRDLSTRWSAACAKPIAPTRVNESPLDENSLLHGDVNLELLPAMMYHEHDAPNPYITAGVVAARDPESGVINLSFHRLMVAGKNRTGIFMEPGKHLDGIFAKYASQGQPMPTATFIGCHPSWLLGATFSGSPDVDEYSIIGGLLRFPLEVVECLTVEGLMVPARSEVVLEGLVSPTQRISEGPFGEFTGYGTGVTDVPVLEVTAMRFRNAPIFQDIASGHTEHLVLPVLGLTHRAEEAVREVTDKLVAVALPAPLTVVVALKESNESETAQVIQQLLASDIYTKHVIAVDADVDPTSLSDVMRCIALNVQADRDVIVMRNQLGTPLDPSVPTTDGRTTKMGIDATTSTNSGRAVTRNTIPQEVLDSIDIDSILSPRSPN